MLFCFLQTFDILPFEDSKNKLSFFFFFFFVKYSLIRRTLAFYLKIEGEFFNISVKNLQRLGSFKIGFDYFWLYFGAIKELDNFVEFFGHIEAHVTLQDRKKN